MYLKVNNISKFDVENYMDDDLYYSGKYFLIINTKYLLTSAEFNSYWTIEYVENDIIYGYNSIYGSTLVFKKNDIKILRDINEYM